MGCYVREDIAIEIGHHHHVERLGRVGQLCGTDIDDPVFVLDFRILCRDLIEDLVEEPVGQFHDVVLGEAGDLPASVALCVLERIADDFFRAWPRDELEALVHVLGLAVLNTGVKILFILADDHDIHLWMLGGHEWRVRNAWPHVRVHPQGLSDGDVQALETAALGSRDRCLKEDFGSPKRFPRFGRDARAVSGFVRAFSDDNRLNVELRASRVQDGERRFHDFGADAITVRNGDGGEVRQVRSPCPWLRNTSNLSLVL